jgi:protein-S-isoprenylcysteine O-methyltransferase Ste14
MKLGLFVYLLVYFVILSQVWFDSSHPSCAFSFLDVIFSLSSLMVLFSQLTMLVFAFTSAMAAQRKGRETPSCLSFYLTPLY